MGAQDRGLSFRETDTDGTAASASHAAVSGKQYFITDIAVSTDKAGALLLVKSGTTVIWQLQIATTAAGINAYSHVFSSPLRCVLGELASVEIDGTSVCNANIAGYESQP